MEYRPRYTQPFTLEEARLLDVPIISEEITRLQNSVAHLQRTQDELQDALSTSPGDTDLTEAFEENEVVIGSQKERITILRMVLVEKGLPMGPHYDVQPLARDRPAGSTVPAVAPVQPNGAHSHNDRVRSSISTSRNGLSDGDGDEDDGVYL
ncbi:uncharacterized protein TRAVEDRAFT_44831 [Trametes versicolor FP-101664 SS1]|uniref:uncharacterized protein n=1 Tax=Trametes versicolor (strain FP-101664) TaxID=717944 RepID=UPI0004621BC3|nr:uncharacterized protein TRAVEDRAFT_44831 [Trametes versicolor FP-101664 SS1]EIW61999.1 hypothetical protein TRAVEDRAFT_44831 [Trametes versicolor FP-101664 SS1]